MISRTGLSALLASLACALAACKSPPSDSAACTCTPGNRALTKAADGSLLDSNALLAQLRLHRREVEEHRTPRDIKVLDDQIRFAIVSFCQPCGDWVQDRMTIEELFPLARLDDATGVVCMGLVLRDGSTAWGDARPRACR